MSQKKPRAATKAQSPAPTNSRERKSDYIREALCQSRKHRPAFRRLRSRKNKAVRRLVAELMGHLRDSLTDVATRRTWFVYLIEALKQDFPEIQAWDRLPLAKLLLALRGFRARTCLYVVFGDLSYLSLVNSVNHAAGDTLVRHTGRLLRSIEKKNRCLPGRLGGDEFSFLLRGQLSAEAVLSLCQNLASDMAKVDIPGEHAGKLTGHMDVGIATFPQSVAVLAEYADRLLALGMSGFPEGEPASKMLLDILVSLADARSIIAKINTRVGLLIELWVEFPDVYNRFIHTLRKGAADITDRKIGEFARLRRQDSDERLRQGILDYALQARSGQPGEDSLLDGLIREAAHRAFALPA